LPTNSSENCNANFTHTACLKLIKKIFCFTVIRVALKLQNNTLIRVAQPSPKKNKALGGRLALRAAKAYEFE
jgi:hypothetical protein